MNDIIIHISDLHITDHTSRYCDKNENSILDTDESNGANITYIQKMCNIINYKFPQNPKILLITGDITNAAEQREFNIAEKYIRLFSKELNIDPTHILLIPGDHDIHRETIKFAIDRKSVV